MKRDTLTNRQNQTPSFVPFILYFLLITVLLLPKAPHLLTLRFNWLYLAGMLVAMLIRLFDPLLKYAEQGSFQFRALVRPMVVELVALIPTIFIIMPSLGAPNGAWHIDFMTSFLTSLFILFELERLGKMKRRLYSLLRKRYKPKGGWRMND